MWFASPGTQVILPSSYNVREKGLGKSLRRNCQVFISMFLKTETSLRRTLGGVCRESDYLNKISLCKHSFIYFRVACQSLMRAARLASKSLSSLYDHFSETGKST